MSQLRAQVNKLLTNVSQMLKPDGFISEDLFPFIGVKQKTGLLGKYGLSHLRIESSIIAGRGKARRIESITRTTDTYSIESHALEGLVTEDDYANVELPFKAEEDEVIGITSVLQIEKEKVLSDALSNTAVITQNVTLSGTSQFSDYDNSDPIAQFSAARLAVKNGCGKQADTAWMDWRVKNILKFHPALLDALGFKFQRSGGLSDDELAKALDVQRVLIADVDYNSAKEGQTDVLASVWAKNIWFGVCPPKAQVQQISAGYRFGMEGRGTRQVYKYPENNPAESTGILIRDDYSFHIANAGAIYLIKNAIA